MLFDFLREIKRLADAQFTFPHLGFPHPSLSCITSGFRTRKIAFLLASDIFLPEKFSKVFSFFFKGNCIKVQVFREWKKR